MTDHPYDQIQEGGGLKIQSHGRISSKSCISNLHSTQATGQLLLGTIPNKNVQNEIFPKFGIRKRPRTTERAINGKSMFSIYTDEKSFTGRD